VTALLVIAAVLAVLYAVLKPLSDGLLDTSAWVAKILAPSDTAEREGAKQVLKFGQAALMEGWLSNVPFVTSIVFWLFFYHWWAAIVIFLVAIVLGVLIKLFWGRSVSYYLWFIYHKMVQRAADYKRDNDLDRASAAESYCKDLREIMAIYNGTRLRPPAPKQLKEIPYGDLYYWRDHGTEAT
jgi:ABC-type multidrug transport system fused ATPase/permease subunit